MSRARESTIQKKAQERRRKAELYSDTARDYLRDHNIPSVINAALERIILEQPDDPLLLLQEELQSYNAQGVRSSVSPARSPQKNAPVHEETPVVDDHEVLEVVQDDEGVHDAAAPSPVDSTSNNDAPSSISEAVVVNVDPNPTESVTSDGADQTDNQQQCPLLDAEADIAKQFVSDIISRVEIPGSEQQQQRDIEVQPSRAVSPSTTAVSEAVLDIEEDDSSAAHS